MRALVPSFGIYLTGIISIFFIDILVVTRLEPLEIEVWTSFKANIAIFMPILSLGMTMTVIREKSLINDVNSLSIIYTILIFLVVLLVYFNIIFDIFISFAAIVSISSSFLIASSLRSQNLLTAAQIYINSWRIFTLLLFYFFSKLYNIFFSLIIFSIIINLIYFSYQRVFKLIFRLDRKKLSSSLLFMLSSFITGYAVTFELFWVTKLGAANDASFTLSVFTIFLVTANIGSGFVGFVLSPMINKNPQYAQLIKKHNISMIVIILIIHSIIYIPLINIFILLYDTIIDTQLVVASILAILVAITRFLYTIYTSIFTANFVRKDVVQFTFQCFSISVVSTIILFSMLTFQINLIIILFGVGLLQWSLRCMFAYRAAFKYI